MGVGLGLPSLSFSSNPSSGATGGQITFSPLYFGMAADEAAVSVPDMLTKLWPYLAIAAVVFLILRK